MTYNSSLPADPTVDYNKTLVTTTNNTTSLLTFPADTDSDGSNFMAIAVTIICVLFSLITIIGFLGNMLVILVVTLNQSMRNSTNLLVLNLAIADLSFIMICVPFTAIKYSTSFWIFGDIWCRIFNYMTYVCLWASVYTLVLMCLDRLFAVVFAIKLPHIRSRRNVTISILVLWTVVFLGNIPACMYHGVRSYDFGDETGKYCGMLDQEMSETTVKLFQVTQFVFGFALPVVIIAVLYGILLAFLLKRADMGGSNAGKGLSKTKRKVTSMVILIVSVFIICWLPIQIILVMGSVGVYPQTIGHVAFQIAANCLAYMNSCMNPFLYTVSSVTFRKAFKDFLCCRTCPCKISRASKIPKISRKKLSSENTHLTNIEVELPANGDHLQNSNNKEETTPFLMVTNNEQK